VVSYYPFETNTAHVRPSQLTQHSPPTSSDVSVSVRAPTPGNDPVAPYVRLPPAQPILHGTRFWCRWAHCDYGTGGTTADQAWKEFRQHFQTSHSDAITNDITTCLWAGCTCTIPRGGRCQGEAPNHPAHVKDILTHIRKYHKTQISTGRRSRR
jgi:hypothetical protein